MFVCVLEFLVALLDGDRHCSAAQQEEEDEGGVEWAGVHSQHLYTAQAQAEANLFR